ncbi:MAG: tryptophan--tRNA ligase [Bacteriovoracaceae bacterium]|jgi:tryptophanyl-tRNA synthetase|nr:tryptophan--tRNA ligase [Halobacteriovoraceae bacterium]MDP7319656.1 tryptophan--tRNA ligase [Bacteriovoracaceae bacterium]
MKTILTGIKPTGDIHLGNLLGAIRPAIELSKSGEYERALYFIADAHALTTVRDPKAYKQYVYEIAATWIALGLDTTKAIFFRQSDIKEVFELAWMLSCMTPKGDMNRAHSYKDRVQKNKEDGKDQDQGINMGLYNYPVLMSADILLYDTNDVPVGKDQIQHVEIARSIAGRCNEYFGEGTLVEPQEIIQKQGAYIPGLDGRKMSKSYGNIIPLWASEKKLKKTINKITTDSSAPEEPKDPNNCLIMEIYRLFASSEQVKSLEQRYREGIGWGYAKAELFEVVNAYLSGPREKFNYLMENKNEIDNVLLDGASKAQAIADETMQRVRKAVTGF